MNHCKPTVPSSTCHGPSLPLGDTHQPLVKPKRPLSAYNYFFKSERERLLASLPVRPQGKPRRSHGKMGFTKMAKVVSAHWKEASAETKEYFEAFAAQDMRRYRAEKRVYDRQRQLVQRQHETEGEGQSQRDDCTDMEPLALPVDPLFGDPLSSLDDETTKTLLALFGNRA